MGYYYGQVSEILGSQAKESNFVATGSGEQELQRIWGKGMA